MMAAEPGKPAVFTCHLQFIAGDIAAKIGGVTMEMIKHVHALDVCRPVLKFFIGFVAGLCAVIAPRMLAALTVPATSDKITFFSFDYMAVSLMFAMMIGAVIMIMEWRQPKKPGDTFIKALGIPALLASALNTTAGISTVNAYVEKNDKITQELDRKADIPTRPFSPIIGEGATPLLESSSLPDVPRASEPDIPARTPNLLGASVLGVFGISAAHASEAAAPSPWVVAELNMGIQINQPQYLVVLDEAATENEAITKMRILGKAIPQARIIQTKDAFLIVHGVEPRGKSEALVDAIRFKERNHLRPSLLEVR